MWVLKTSCQTSDGPNISLWHKGAMSGIIACTRKTRVTFFWRRMGRHRAAKEQITLKFGIYLSPKVKNGEVTLFWCPTGNVIGNYM